VALTELPQLQLQLTSLLLSADVDQ
jgi:hypothetical protein